jgi:hypothetical protein
MHRFQPEMSSRITRSVSGGRQRLQRFALVIATAAALGGCGDSDEGVPAACKEGEDAVRAALRDAPGAVRIDGTPLSGCLSEEADAGELQVVGTAFVESASDLAREARRRPEGHEALQLGYLVAAAHRGARSTQGVHSELLRRLDQELLTIDTRSRAFRRGRRAGRADG